MSRDPSEGQTLASRRQQRLRDELLDSGIELPANPMLANKLIEELDYARFPPVHEGILPTYGAVLTGLQVRPEVFGGTPSSIEGLSDTVLRRLADGRQSFVLRGPAGRELLLLDNPHDREAALVRLRSRGPLDLTIIVQRGPGGVVRVLAPDGLFIWDGAHWWAKPYASSFTRAVQRAVPTAPIDTLRQLLEFCVHTMSPADAGTALVWALDADTVADVEGLNAARPPTRVPQLPFSSIATGAAIRQLLAQVDGAAIVNRAGQLIAIGAHLRSSPASHEHVKLDPTRGTRHAASRRYSYDHTQSVVFVVSRDGPVTVYSKGEEVTSIQTRIEEPENDEERLKLDDSIDE